MAYRITSGKLWSLRLKDQGCYMHSGLYNKSDISKKKDKIFRVTCYKSFVMNDSLKQLVKFKRVYEDFSCIQAPYWIDTS